MDGTDDDDDDDDNPSSVQSTGSLSKLAASPVPPLQPQSPRCTAELLWRVIRSPADIVRATCAARQRHGTESAATFHELQQLLEHFMHATSTGDSGFLLDYPNGVEPDAELVEALRTLNPTDKADPLFGFHFSVVRKSLRPDGCPCGATKSCTGFCLAGIKPRVQLEVKWSQHLHTTISPR